MKRLRLFALTFASLGLATFGCAALTVGGPHRSAQLSSGDAPAPTVATTVLACVAKALPPGSGDGPTARFDALARAAMPGAVPLSPAATSVLCETVAASEAFHAWRETTPPPSAAAVIRELAQAAGARSLAVPALRLYARCEQDTKTVRDANGVPIATVEEKTQTCRLDRVKDVGVFLFAADGTILYRSTKRVGMGSSTDPEPEMNEVLANLPAKVAAPIPLTSPVMTAPATAGTPAAPPAPVGVAADDPKVDAALAAIDPKTPSDCRNFAKSMCRNSNVPDTSRLAMCNGYVSTVNQLVKQQGPKAPQACKGLVKSAPM